ncbi:MAG: Tol-Pal system beta propeller repeat protein TolB [Rickettsiales bacterium]|nr:Tol-Pal system beta propeller repeat protein TolB [Rickettsiales bacterium]|tara:strand:+ start:3215 stop:4543 length:1329 start_codon:yes stop_codon:yes gene_type:complete
MKFIVRASILFVIGFFVFTQNAQAELQVNITRGSVEPLPIAVKNFSADTAENAKLGRDMAQIVRRNLAASGLFDPIDPNRFPSGMESENPAQPQFKVWRGLSAQALAIGTIQTDASGQTRLEFRLWDIYAEKQMIGLAYTTTPSNWRRIAHIMSDEIYSRITGEAGYFDSRIVYIAESGSPIDRKKRLAIMDQDGANHRFLTSGNELVLTPRFSPNQQMITYLSYFNNRPRVYLYDLSTGRQKVLGDFRGMTFAPRFSPDGQTVVMSYAENGNTDIFEMNIKTEKTKPLTRHPGIDTAPSYSPDGKNIVFESDRSGTQQLYIMDRDGDDVRRITFGDGRYANPVWSPRGDLIAFTKMKGGLFYIGVVKPNGTGERIIAQAYHAEGPTWSPNGRVIAYFKETRGTSTKGKTSSIYTIDLTGYNEQKLQTPEGASDPAWSPVNE